MREREQFAQNELQQRYREALQRYFTHENVTGVDIGYRIIEDNRSDVLVVRIHTRGVEPEEFSEDLVEMELWDFITAQYQPEEGLLLTTPPTTLPLPPRQQRRDPIQPGISIGRGGGDGGTRGTLGLIMQNSSGKNVVLSAAHVLDGIGSGGVFQPSPRDLAGSNNRIGKLGKVQLQEVDAAIGILNNSRGREFRQCDTGVLVHGARRVTWGDRVEKSSRSTAVRRGIVDGVGRYKYMVSGTVVAVEGFRVVPETLGEEISAPGDSGALWYHIGSAEGAGLHVAGEIDPHPGAEHAIASHFDLVLEMLKIQFP